MEWTTCVEIARAEIEVVDTAAKTQWVSTSRAFTRGTPSVATERARITHSCIAFSHSRQAERDYLRAFQLPESFATGKHLVFEAKVDSVRYVVPALVLMRALFTPARYLLDTMFRPHALDQTCFLDFGPSQTGLTILASWATEANARRFAPWSSRLKWMLSHESACRMAGSVHEFALQGIIGLQMPLATISMVVEGVRKGSDFYVTKCTLFTIEPEETPNFGMEATPIIIANNDAHFLALERPTRPSASTTHIPAHADGSVDLSDSEWELLRPAILRNSGNRYKHCPRLLLDGVLAKLASGKAWMKAEYKVGNWQNASFTHQTLRKSGVLDEIMDFLRDARTCS